jgi:hypothetical protein
MSINELKENIQDNTEWLQTIDGDQVECIGIENLEGLLSEYFGTKIKLTQD